MQQIVYILLRKKYFVAVGLKKVLKRDVLLKNLYQRNKGKYFCDIFIRSTDICRFEAKRDVHFQDAFPCDS